MNDIQSPAAALRSLAIGDAILLPQYQLTSQVASTVQRLKKLHGLYFATCATEKGVRVTRVEPPPPTDLLYGVSNHE